MKEFISDKIDIAVVKGLDSGKGIKYEEVNDGRDGWLRVASLTTTRVTTGLGVWVCGECIRFFKGL